MDPLSLSLGIAGLLPLIAVVIRRTKKYHDDVKGARSSVNLLIAELEALESTLVSLDAFLDNERSGSLSSCIDQKSVLRTCATACEAKLKALALKLGQAANGRIGRLLWPLSEGEQRKAMQEIRSFTLWMQFALSVDGIRLLSQTTDNVMKTMGQQLQQFETLQAIEETTAQVQAAVNDQSRRLDEDREAKNKAQVLDWISGADHNQKQHALSATRVRDTGRWLLRRPEYIAWRDDHDSSNVLCGYGNPGTGKTVLTSVVVDDVLDMMAPKSACPVAFVYFDYQVQSSQTAMSALSSILRQLVAAFESVPVPVQNAYEAHLETGRAVNVDEIHRLTLSVAELSERLYIVIDALDECEGRQRKAFLDALQKLTGISSVRLFATGRPHIHDFSAFQSQTELKVEADDDDLRACIRHELDRGGVVDLVGEEFAAQIVEKLVGTASGMFLLPILQVRNIVSEPTVGDMEEALESLSTSLPRAYEETVARIQRLPESRAKLGMAVLQWVCFAQRPLAALEIQDILSMRDGRRSRDARYRPSLKVLVECCQGLVLVDDKSRTVRFAHYTVQEYLATNANFLFPHAGTELSSACLAYMMLPALSSGPAHSLDELRGRMENHPFASYAGLYWKTHTRMVDGHPDIHRLALELVRSRTMRAVLKQMSAYLDGYRWTYCQPEECLSMSALHCASWAGLESIVHDLLASGEAGSLDLQTHIGTTALILSTSCGHHSITQTLLDHSGDPYLQNWYGNALHCAAEAGESVAVQQLVSHGMPPGADPRYHRLPILCTIDNDYVETFVKLIDLGADISGDSVEGGANRHFRHGMNILHEAAIAEASGITRLILERNLVDINKQCSRGRTALHYAARYGSLETLRVLLEAGADISIADKTGTTALAIPQGGGQAALDIMSLYAPRK